jgi:hypothetical protein
MAKQNQRSQPNSPTAPRDRAPRQEPVWRNTRPRGNPETHTRDLERSRERFESVLGR